MMWKRMLWIMLAGACAFFSVAYAAPLGADVIVEEGGATVEPPQASITATPIVIEYQWREGEDGSLGWADATLCKYAIITIENLETDTAITANVTLSPYDELPRGIVSMGLSLAPNAGADATSCATEPIEPGGEGKVYLNIVTRMDGTTNETLYNEIGFTVELVREE